MPYRSTNPSIIGAPSRNPEYRANMRPQLPLLILSIALLGSQSAWAAKWVALGSRDKARIEVDANSLVTGEGGKISVWHRESYPEPRLVESGAFSFSRVSVLDEIHCDKRSIATLQKRYAKADDTEIRNEPSESTEARSVTPDTASELVFDYACKRAAKPAAAPATVAPPPPPPTEAAQPAAKETAKKSKPGKNDKEEVPHAAPHWSYDGETGADKWGSLDKSFETCAIGQRQSPIDIRRTVLADLPPIKFAYKPVPLSIVDNGHSIKVDTPGAGEITVDGESYELQQFHFHKPSEEKIRGRVYDMVAHLVHQSKSGKLAVVAVLFEAGKEQALIRTLWTHLPLERDKPVTRPEVKIDLMQLLPARRSYFTFLGSLTTPPCSEGVLWLVLKSPVQMSKEQLAGFGTIYKSNVRPVQPVNSRLIKESR